jgi:methyl coenzyme M reductase subunit D
MTDETKYEDVVKKFDYDPFTMADEIVRLSDEIQRIKREMYKEALNDMRQIAAPLFAELEKRKEGAMIDEIKYENVVKEFDYDSFTMGEEIVRLRKRLAAIEILHKQWVVKFLGGYERAQQIIDALTEILHKKEDA